MPYTATVTWPSMVTLVGGEARLQQYFPGDTSGSFPKLTEAIAIASGELDSYFDDRYQVPLDEPLPEPVASFLRDRVLHFGTRTVPTRPASIQTAADAALDFWKAVNTGKASVKDINAATVGGQAKAVVFTSMIAVNNPFDTENPDSAINVGLPRFDPGRP